MAVKFKDAEGIEHEVLTAQEINDAITGAVKRQTKSLGDDLTKKLGELVTSGLGETLTAFETKVTGLIDEKTAAGKPKPGEPPAADDIAKHPLFLGLKKQFEDLKTDNEKTKSEAAAEKAKAKDASLRTSLSERLTKAGFDPKRVHLALGTLIDAQKRVRYADDDSIVFRGDDNEEVDLETGLKAWSQTDDAKTYMPPRGASGSGDRPGGKAPGQGQTGTPTVADLGRAALHAAGFAQRHE